MSETVTATATATTDAPAATPAPVATKVGVVALTDCSLALISLAGFIVKELRTKTGVVSQIAGAFADIQNNPAFLAKLEVAFNEMGQIPAEVKDLDMKESLQLAMAIVPAIVGEVTGL